MKHKDSLVYKAALFLVLTMLVTAPVAPAAFADTDRATVVTADDDDDRLIAVEDDDDGLFEGPLDVVGEVLALPFRLVANVLDGIF